MRQLPKAVIDVGGKIVISYRPRQVRGTWKSCVQVEEAIMSL